MGENVEAYNSQTGKAEAEPVQHVWVNHDSDLVDVRVSANTSQEANVTTTTAHAQASGHGLVVGNSTSAAVHLSHNQQTANATADETIHTTANHPWLTADRGWVAAGDLRPGESLVTLNGATGTVLWVRVTAGAADRYNLTVAHDHTYAVGAGLWVVHNTCGGLPTTTSTGLDGSTTVTSGSTTGNSPYFQSVLSGDQTEFSMTNAFRNGLPAHASEVFADQFALAGGDAGKLQKLVLVEPIEPDTLYLLTNTSSASGSPLDVMAHFFSDAIGVNLGPPIWNGLFWGG